VDLELGSELDDTGSNFDQAQPQSIKLHNSPSRTFGQDAAHRPQQPIGASVQEQAKLVGLGRRAGGAVGGEVVLALMWFSAWPSEVIRADGQSASQPWIN
jgi:hypothetical protein